MLHAMIMAGGGGTRFWPRSRQRGPSSSSPSAATARCCRGPSTASRRRCRRNAPGSSPAPSTAPRRVEQLRESCRRSRSSASRSAATRRRASASGRRSSREADPDATMMVMPADHVIEPAQEFRRAVHAAEQIADDFPDALITFGIPPTFPSTGYGYIHRGEHVGTAAGRRRLPRAGVPGEAGRRRGRAVRRVAASTSGTAASSSGSRPRSSAQLEAASPNCTPPCSGSPTPGAPTARTTCSAASTRRPRRSASTSR